MQVLWWLVPPLVATVVAMVWAGWTGCTRDDVARDDSDEARERMQRALARTPPRSGKPLPAGRVEPTHGVAVRRTASTQPSSSADYSR